MDRLSTEDPPDRRIADLARRQHGVVSRAELRALGLSRAAIEGRVKRGLLHRVHHGVYAVGHLRLTRNGHFMAAVLACGDGAALSHFSAAVLWGMRRDQGGAVHVTAEKRRRIAGLVAHESPLAGERVRRLGIVVTTPARTLIDLADVAPRRLVERAMDEADYLRLDCTGVAPRHGRRGSGILSSVLAVHTIGATRTRSEMEEIFLALCDDHGVPRPEVNAQVEGYECDFVWRAERLIVETDGGAAHGTSSRLERDPVRDADLQLAGWLVLRVTYNRLLSAPAAVADQVVRALTPAPRRAAARASPHPP